MGRRERKKRENRRRILDAARDTFAEKGFQAATTRGIAQRADVSVGTLFNYFDDKRHLLFAVFGDAFRNLHEEAFASLPRDAPLVDQLLHLFTTFFEFHERDVSLSRVFMKELLFLEGEARRTMMTVTLSLIDDITELVEDAKRRGELSDRIVPVQASLAFFGCYYLVVAAWLGGFVESRQLRDTALRVALDVLMDGMRTHRGA